MTMKMSMNLKHSVVVVLILAALVVQSCASARSAASAGQVIAVGPVSSPGTVVSSTSAPQASSAGLHSAADARSIVLERNADRKLLNFAFITDVHASGVKDLGRFAGPCLEHFVDFCNERICDFAAFGGDLYSAYGATRADAVGLIPVAMSYFNRIEIPVFLTKGNHDRNGKLTQEETLTNIQYHLLCERHTGSADVHFNGADPYGNYYFADFPTEKVRVVNLNYFDACVLQKSGVHETQLAWLAAEALNADRFPGEGWTVILMAHNYESCGEDFWSIVDTLNRSGKAVVAAFIHGDMHEDLHAVVHGVNCVGVACAYCGETELGTPKEDCFSVFSLDTVNRVLYEPRVGRGHDRSFTW